jgi:hypothetical protein
MKHVITAAVVLFLLAAFAPGKTLPSATEITLIEPVLALGFDKGEITFKLAEGIEQVRGSSETPAAALEAMKQKHPREVAVSAADFFLFGADINLQSTADYILREQPLRLTASVFVVQGSANSALTALEEEGSLDALRNFGEHSGTGAYSSLMPFYEFMREMAVPGRSFAAPALTSAGVPDGYAVIKNARVAGFLPPPASRGYNIIKNKQVYSVVGDNNLETARCKIRFNFSGDVLTGIDINVEISTSEPATRRQRETIAEEIESAVEFAKLHEADFMGFGDLLRIRHPYRYERIKADWDGVFAELPVQINVTGR